MLHLPRSTYYDRLKRDQQVDKYQELKEKIKQIYKDSRETYGYRRIWSKLRRLGYQISINTVLRLTNIMGITVNIYSKHTSGYHSYHGQIGSIAPNLLQQKFNETKPYAILHTDVTQVKLMDRTKGYISAILDEASGEIMSCVVTNSPNKSQIMKTIKDLEDRIPKGSAPILHSDQGWIYQMNFYQKKLKSLKITQSMSRKGNCLDNAPIESFFNILKRECLYRYKIHNLTELQKLVSDYVHWYNHERISLKRNGLAPVAFRNKAIA